MQKWFEKTGGESHPSGYNFLGPRTLFVLRNIGPDGDFYEKVMTRAGLPLIGKYPYDTPVNFIDQAAFDHDRVFSNIDATEDEVREADEAFIAAINKEDLAPDVYELATQQVAGGLIRLKTVAEDFGLVRKGLFSKAAQVNFTREVLGRNETLPDDLDHASFWGIVIDTFLRGTKWLKDEAIEAGVTVGTGIGVTLASRLAQRRRVPVVGAFVASLARKLARNTGPVELIRSAEASIRLASDFVIQGWFDKWGISGEMLQYAARYGIRNVILAMVDKLPDWIAASMKSDEWQDMNTVTEADIERVMKRQFDPDRRPDLDATISDLSGLRDAMRNIAGQTPAERINNVLSILRIIRDVNPTRENKLNAIRTALSEADIFKKIRLLRGSSTIQVIRSILREKVSSKIANELVDKFKDQLLLPGENEPRLRTRLVGMNFIGLISQARMLQEFKDLLQ
jgi:hypothetical protein